MDLKKLGEEVGAFVEEKNKNYGHSFKQANDFIKFLYPNGIKPEQYVDFIASIRIFDKLKRIATNENAYGEEPKMDLLGLIIRWIKNNPTTEEK
jgi:hypothetical protein